MYKIKLLILLLISINLISCTSKNIYQSNKYSVGYIGNSFEGLLLRNNLESNLRGSNIYNQQSKFVIKGDISIGDNIYVPTTSKTSQRQNVTTSINFQIFNNELGCEVYKFEEVTSQFYIYASGTYFLSNKKAREKIINDNINMIIIQFLNTLPDKLDTCEQSE